MSQDCKSPFDKIGHLIQELKDACEVWQNDECPNEYKVPAMAMRDLIIEMSGILLEVWIGMSSVVPASEHAANLKADVKEILCRIGRIWEGKWPITEWQAPWSNSEKWQEWAWEELIHEPGDK